MKRNSIMEECRKLITPDIKRSVDYSIFVANRIFDILEKQGKTQRELANALGKSEAEISKWLHGTHTFTTKTIAKIEIALGESIFDISNQSKKTEYVTVFISINAETTISAKKNKPTMIPLNTGWADIVSINEKACMHN